jgi:hypothetical protein
MFTECSPMQAIFKGEIDKAPGEVAGAEEH